MSFDWKYLLSLASYSEFWTASLTVVWLSVLTWCVSVALGFGVAIARTEGPGWLRQLSAVYIWFFRSVPLLVLLIFIYNLPQMLPELRPVLSNPFWAGAIALIVSEVAYISEIHRGGLISIDRGQHEAAHVLGIRSFGKYFKIIVPQAFRVAMPTLSNEFITIVKLTSLVSVISLSEILLVGQRLYTRNFLVIETLVAVSVYYVLIVTIFTWIARWIENHLDVTRRRATETEIAKTRFEHPVVTGERIRKSDIVVDLNRVRKSFGDKRVVNDISLQIRSGEVVCLIGPSGSGKTTLLRTINALQDIDGGTICFHGEDWICGDGKYQLSQTFRDDVIHLGMVFQSFNLFPHLTVLENVTLGPRYHTMGSADELRAFAMLNLDKVGMAAHAQKYPHQLSGGQKQRVAIARALAMKPLVMLFDEPTSALDPEMVSEVLQTIEGLAAEGMTMLIVTHEMRFAARISDRIIMLENGSRVAEASADDLRNGITDARIRRFMEQSQH
ncbi:amino acid ABC transporter permease/ATP-binding protein [Roseibium algicola]|uniref:Amino acid ABC transporter permease/ATP-binding protein n=2 Tax=Roseibium algicola TaxID=2857014 RepID=A0ABN4WYH1_9HYPH|nr:amino acid ABC transporter permease/ATP-binding protein [Roseibium aggregatum]